MTARRGCNFRSGVSCRAFPSPPHSLPEPDPGPPSMEPLPARTTSAATTLLQASISPSSPTDGLPVGCCCCNWCNDAPPPPLPLAPETVATSPMTAAAELPAAESPPPLLETPIAALLDRVGSPEIGLPPGSCCCGREDSSSCCCCNSNDRSWSAGGDAAPSDTTLGEEFDEDADGAVRARSGTLTFAITDDGMYGGTSYIACCDAASCWGCRYTPCCWWKLQVVRHIAGMERRMRGACNVVENETGSRWGKDREMQLHRM